MSEELIAGRNAVMEALRGQRSFNKILLQDKAKGGSIAEIMNAAKERHIPVELVKLEKLDKLVPGIRHQGVVAYAAPIPFSSLEEVFAKAAAQEKHPFVVLLDELQDPQNVGAILRTADACGVHGVLLPKRHSCPLNAVVAKISAGAVEHVPVVQIGNIVQTMKELQEQGFWIVGADMDGETYFKANLTGPICLVIGAEGKGVGRLVKETCDHIVSMPMLGQVNSLNASNAAAVLMYEVVRQRLTAK